MASKQLVLPMPDVLNSNFDLPVDIYFMKDWDLMTCNLTWRRRGALEKEKGMREEGRRGERLRGEQERREIDNGL